MTINLTCTQISSLLSFYIEDKLSEKLKNYIAAHLESCPSCMSKYQALKSIFSDMQAAKKQIDEYENIPSQNSYYQTFRKNLSAYVDNELSENESIKVKKFAIKNPYARQEMENLYTIRNLMNSNYEKTKNDLKYDLSAHLMNKITLQDEIYQVDPMIKVVSLLIIISTCIVVCTALAFFV